MCGHCIRNGRTGTDTNVRMLDCYEMCFLHPSFENLRDERIPRMRSSVPNRPSTGLQNRGLHAIAGNEKAVHVFGLVFLRGHLMSEGT